MWPEQPRGPAAAPSEPREGGRRGGQRGAPRRSCRVLGPPAGRTWAFPSREVGVPEGCGHTRVAPAPRCSRRPLVAIVGRTDCWGVVKWGARVPELGEVSPVMMEPTSAGATEAVTSGAGEGVSWSQEVSFQRRWARGGYSAGAGSGSGVIGWPSPPRPLSLHTPGQMNE